MTRKHAGVLVFAMIVVAAIWGFGVGGSTAAQVPTIPDIGTSVAQSSLPASLQSLLKDAGLASDLRLRHVASDGVAFYTYRRSDGALCFSADGSGVCPSSDRSSLFEGGPVTDVIRVGPPVASSGTRPMLAWRGLALDDIARVAIIDVDGTAHSVPVIDNTFELQGPIADPASFEALDSTGKIVWNQSIDWPKS